MTSDILGEQGVTRARRHDRRQGLDPVVSAVTGSLRGQAGPGGVRTAFEEAFRKVLRLPGVHLLSGVDVPDECPPLALDPTGVLRVPIRISEGSESAVLEIAAPDGRQLDGWERQLVERAAHLAALVLEVERAQAWRAHGLSPARSRDGAAPLIGTSVVMKGLRERIERLAATDFTVLIEGESGSGKELVARQIHELSRRRRGPFVAINCAALVETLLEAELFGIEDRTATGVRGRRGKFEHAASGTLFLDEVSDLSMSAQAKLLRAIQECAIERVGGNQTHRVDLRLVVATNKRLSEMVERGLFREDLFYRLSGIDLSVPPLRTRRGDILELARYFLQKHHQTRCLELSAAAGDALASYDWPGNVRELERLMEGAVALVRGPRIELDDLPPIVRGTYGETIIPSLNACETLRHWGTRYVRLMFDRCGRNKRETCRVLDISYHTLQAYLKQAELPDLAASAPLSYCPKPGGNEQGSARSGQWLNGVPQFVHDRADGVRLRIGTES